MSLLVLTSVVVRQLFYSYSVLLLLYKIVVPETVFSFGLSIKCVYICLCMRMKLLCYDLNKTS